MGTTTSPQYKYNFQYDKLNRLKAADFTSICILGSRRCGAIIGVDDQNATTTSLTLSQDLGNFTYDANGNLLSLHRRNQSGSTEDNLAYTYSQNRLTSLMDNAYNNLPGYATAWASFQYDANGNLTQVLDEVDYIPQFSAIYDVRNLPTAISHVTGGNASYRYNAAGQRIYKNVNGTVEHYVMNGSEPIAVLNADGTLRYWITSFGRAEKSGSSYVAYYYLKDHLGSTRVVMKEDGTRVEGIDYDPWGVILGGRNYQNGSLTKERFTGKERDAASGLDYFIPLRSISRREE
ncbi:MAG: hypothetical protein J0L94_04450 [Rhodothermia bacterium]|nr:hypothetical protein [Rhodothermia bacterium]